MVLFGLFLITLSFGQNTDRTIPKDTANIEIKYIDTDVLKSFRNDPRFEYDRRLREEVSILDSIWEWFQSLFPNVAETVKKSFWSIFFYGLIAVTIVLVVLQLLGIKVQHIFKRDEHVNEHIVKFTDDINTIKIEDLILQYENELNYHEALRYRYLKLLKWLDTNHFIEWKSDKTNYHYLREMNKEISLFQSIILTVEYVCYGEFKIDKNDYDNEVERHDELKQRLS